MSSDGQETRLNLNKAELQAQAASTFNALLFEYLSAANVSELLGIDGKTGKEIDKRALQQAFANPDCSGPYLFSIDEIYYQ